LKALFDAPGNEAQGELAFRTGDIIYIVKDEEGGWYEGELNGKRGYVPGTYVERVKRVQAGARPGAKPGAAKAAGKPMFTFTEGGGAPPPAAAGKVKCDWEEMKTDDGQVYYWNEKKQESVWDKPAELVAAERAAAAPAAMSPVSSSVSQGCATAGCGKPRFGGKPYCAQHASGGGAGSNGAPAAGGRPGFGGAGAGAGSSGAPAAKWGGGGGGAAANPTPVPAARPAFGGAAAGGNSNAAPAAGRPAARFGGGAPASNGPAGGGGAAARGPISTGAVAANRANLFGGGGIPMGGLRPGGAGAPAAAAAPARPAAPAKSDWIAVVDESSGSTYYWNEKTQESSWDKPAGFVG
jgi:hypothetical protein